MMIRKRFFLILAAALAAPLLWSGHGWAAQQGGGEGGPRGEEGRRGPMTPDDRLKQLKKDFNLTADQQAKIKPILVDSQKKMEDLRDESSGDRRAMRGKMMQLLQDTNAKIREQLDDKQKEKFDKLQQERMDRMRDRRGGPGGPGGPGDDTSGPPPRN